MDAQTLFTYFGISVGLVVVFLIIGIKFRRQIWFNIQAWWKSPRGFGIMRILYNDGRIEERIEYFEGEEIIIKRKVKGRDDKEERYSIEKKLVKHRKFDNIPLGYWRANCPFMIDFIGVERKISINKEVDGKLINIELTIPEIKYEPEESADVLDSMILRHKMLQNQDDKKALKTIIIILIIGFGVMALLMCVMWFMLQKGQQDTNSQIALIKALYQQMVSKTL